MRILVVGILISCIFVASFEAMQDSSDPKDNFKKLPLQLDLSSFADSELQEYTRQNNYKDVRFLGVAHLSDSCLLAISLATLSQKDDVCIFSKKISWAVQAVPGIKCKEFSHSRIISPDKITKVEISQGDGLLGVTVDAENKKERCKDMLVFKNYLGLEAMVLIAHRNLETQALV